MSVLQLQQANGSIVGVGCKIACGKRVLAKQDGRYARYMAVLVKNRCIVDYPSGLCYNLHMKCLIVKNAFDKGASQQRKLARIIEELVAAGVEYEVAPNDSLLATITGGVADSRVEADFCFYFDKDKYVAELLEKRGLRLFNSAEAMAICDDKMQTHIRLAGSGVPMPDTISAPLCYTPLAFSDEFLHGVTARLGLPLIVKQCYGSFGEQVYLAKTTGELASIVDRIKGSAYLFQRYVAESSGTDTRVIVIGGRAVCAMRRVNPKDFRSNVELGGVACPVELTAELAAICELAAKTIGLDYCGVDVLSSTDGPLVCEVNSNAMFNAMEQVTGLNIAKRYVEYAISTVKDKQKIL